MRDGFRELVENGWADVIMPDIKHVGGLTALVEVIRRAPDRIDISPHNPSRPIATGASLHAAALSKQATSTEIPLITNRKRAYYLPWLSDGCLAVPQGPGWGVIKHDQV